MRKKIKELYEHSTLVAKIRYSYLCLLVPFVLFLICTLKDLNKLSFCIISDLLFL